LFIPKGPHRKKERKSELVQSKFETSLFAAAENVRDSESPGTWQ
jgi:hypothetical protein